MSIRTRIREHRNKFTASDERIADYFSQQPSRAALQSASEIGADTGTSPSAVTRLVRKLNYNSLKEAQLDLASDNREKPAESLIIEESDTPASIAGKIKQYAESALKGALELLNMQTLGQVAGLLRRADTVYLSGIGASGIVALDFHQKLSRIGKRSVFHMDSSMQMTMAAHTSPRDAMLLFSYNGQTSEVVAAARCAGKNGTPCVAVTKPDMSPLLKLAEYHLYVPASESEFRLGAIQSRYAQLMIADILFAAVALENFEETKRYLHKTQQAVSESKTR